MVPPGSAARMTCREGPEMTAQKPTLEDQMKALTIFCVLAGLVLVFMPICLLIRLRRWVVGQ